MSTSGRRRTDGAAGGAGADGGPDPGVDPGARSGRPPIASRMTAPATPTIEIPARGVVVLVGPAGAGKSTLARRLFVADEVLSSDALRGALSGDEGDQSASRVAFSILHREIERRLAVGRLVVVDATNLQRVARSAILRRAAAARVPTIAIVLAVPPKVVHGRNARRAERVVPPQIVDRHLDELARLGLDREAIAESLTAEGFASVVVLETVADLDAINAVRVNPTP
jgi:predicted kinase